VEGSAAIEQTLATLVLSGGLRRLVLQFGNSILGITEGLAFGGS